MAVIQISNDLIVHITIPFPPDPRLIEKVNPLNSHSKIKEICPPAADKQAVFCMGLKNSFCKIARRF